MNRAFLVGVLLSSCVMNQGAAQSGTLKGRPSSHVDYWLTHRDESANLPPKNIGNEVYYQVFLDRFANGNRNNDCLDGSKFCDPSHQDWYRYWGGDLRGLIERLPYLKNLGVTRLWITPIFDNTDVTVERVRHGRHAEVTSYHGYWIRDWFTLNPYFTDRGDRDYDIVRELVAAAKPEIGVLLDSVANHTSPADATAWSLDYQMSREPLAPTQDGAPRTHRGVLFEDGRYVTSLDEDEYRTAHDRHYKRFFHRYGPIIDYNSMYQTENYQLDGLSDLDQTNPELVAYMDRAHAFWMEQVPGLAGYRMDTIKHVPQNYWLDFDQTFFSRFSDKEIIGEYYGAGPYNRDSYDFYRETRQSVFDFDFRNALMDVFKNNAPMDRLSKLWRNDHKLIDSRDIITFIDNHDVPRMRGLGMSEKRMRQAIAVWFLSRGVPCVYYGLEQDLFYPRDPGDPYNRPMMTSFDEGHEFFRLIKKLSALRVENPALRYGDTHIVHESKHILAFERVHENDRALIVTSKNPIAGTDDFSIQHVTLPDGNYTDVLSGKAYRVANGQLPVSLADGQTIILSTR